MCQYALSGWVSCGKFRICIMKVVKQVTAAALRYLIKALLFIKRLFPASHYALLALLFIVGLELIFALQRWVLVVAQLVIVVVSIGVVLVRIEESGKFTLSNMLLPILAAIGLCGFGFLLPTSYILHLYIIAAGAVLFFILKHGARQAYPIWNWMISLLVYFLNIAFILGLRFHLYLPIIFLLFLVFMVTALLAWQALRRLASGSVIMLPVAVMAFVLTQLVWVMQFLPVHYLIQAGLTTSGYYVMFNLLGLSMKRKITKGDYLEYGLVGLTAIIIILLSAQWI